MMGRSIGSVFFNDLCKYCEIGCKINNCDFKQVCFVMFFDFFLELIFLVSSQICDKCLAHIWDGCHISGMVVSHIRDAFITYTGWLSHIWDDLIF